MKQLLIIAFILFSILGKAQLPTGFIAEDVGSNWNAPMGIVFDANNRSFVWERGGKVFVFQGNIKTEILDITEEVHPNLSLGLISMVLDPNFNSNGYFYILYTVDRHHLLYYGTPSYSPTASLTSGATISRVTRYTADVNTNYTSVISGSRYVLIGSNINNGLPQTGNGHTEGDLKFGTDGSLIISCGDGALDDDYELQAYTDGILNTDEYNARRLWRCQILNSYNGKILRINPNTGEGYASNPFYLSGQANAIQSKIYARGLRNPFRMTIKPGTGSTNIAAGNPGTIVLGDVGQYTKEEINIIPQGGLNFGWPKFEGIDHVYISNPTYEPASFVKPVLEYGRTGSTARVQIHGQTKNVGSVDFPFSNFTGNAAIGGVFYPGHVYPEEYHDTYFFAEFNDKWVKTLSLDVNNNPVSKSDFSPNLPGLIYLTYNPYDEFLYYAAVPNKVVRLKYDVTTNQAPKAKIGLSGSFGPAPFNVQFVGTGSTDPENAALSYVWNFGDGNSSTLSNPNHTFYSTVGSAPQAFTVSLTVTDIGGLSNTATQIISTNNTPPIILSTNLQFQNSVFTNGTSSVPLSAVISDAEESTASLASKWEVELHHNSHAHPEFLQNSTNATFYPFSISCDPDLYFYKYIFTLSDSYGLSTKYEKNYFPNCNSSDINPPTIPNIKVEAFTNNSFSIAWANIADNIAAKSIEVFINNTPVAVVLSSTSSYVFNDIAPIAGKWFTAKIIVRDAAANATESSIVYFQAPSCLPYCGFTDNNAPSYPFNISKTNPSNGNFNISWNASYDAIDPIVSYEIYLDGLLQASTNGLSYAFTGLAGIHTVHVQAVDDFGNKAASNTLTLTSCVNAIVFANFQTISNEVGGIYKAAQMIQASNTITNTSNITYQANNSILLLPGFKVDPGSVFKTRLIGCN
jgi:glucose/arabinose dehydrogenase